MPGANLKMQNSIRLRGDMLTGKNHETSTPVRGATLQDAKHKLLRRSNVNHKTFLQCAERPLRRKLQQKHAKTMKRSSAWSNFRAAKRNRMTQTGATERLQHRILQNPVGRMLFKQNQDTENIPKVLHTPRNSHARKDDKE